MCFSSPKPPKATNAPADPELSRQRMQAEIDAAAIKAENKERRMEDRLAQLSGRIGRKSLFTGGQGGIGFPGMMRRFSGGGVPANPTPPPTGGGGGGRPPRPRPTFEQAGFWGALARETRARRQMHAQ